MNKKPSFSLLVSIDPIWPPNKNAQRNRVWHIYSIEVLASTTHNEQMSSAPEIEVEILTSREAYHILIAFAFAELI
jgi:hypothetical protein